MKYKVGDKVRIKKELKEGKKYGDCVATYSMIRLAGKIVTIKRVNANSYKIEEDNNDWYWTKEMFEGSIKLTKKELFDMPIGTKIKVEKDDDTFSILIKVEGEYFVDIEECDQLIKEDDVEDDLRVNCWGYTKIIEVQEPNYSTVYIENEDDKKEMTIAEIEEKLGYPIKIVKEKTNE